MVFEQFYEEVRLSVEPVVEPRSRPRAGDGSGDVELQITCTEGKVYGREIISSF